MNLQKELYEARNYHINLHVEYTQLKNAYEKLVNVTDEEWQYVEKFDLAEPINRVISKFWEDVEFITTAFFDILELLNRKDYLEKSILSIWKSQIQNNNFRDASKETTTSEEVVPSSEDGISIVPGYLEYLNSQLIELKGRIKWVEYNLMKYKFAASHGPELKSTIDNLLRCPKKHQGKWQMFSRSSRRPKKKLEEEVTWYKKKLKFFREDVQRIKSVQQAIFLKYVSPDDRKRFPSRTHTLENALKGIPSNYPGSWIETSRHSGLSLNPSVLSSTSGNSPLPLTSLAGPIRMESHSHSSTHQPSAAQPDSGSAVNISESIRIQGTLVENRGDSSQMSTTNADKVRSESGPLKHLAYQDRKLFPIGMVALEQRKCIASHMSGYREISPSESSRCQGDLNSMNSTNQLFSGDFCSADSKEPPGTSEMNEKSAPAETPNDEDNVDKDGSTVTKAPSNPFEGDDAEDSNPDMGGDDHEDPKASEVVGCDVITDVPKCRSDAKNQDVITATSSASPHRQSSSAYDSAEEMANPGIDQPTKIKPKNTHPNPVRATCAYSGASQLASNIYIPCSLPCQAPAMPSGASYNPGTPNYPFAYADMASYGLFNRIADRSDKTVLKKITTFLHVRKK